MVSVPEREDWLLLTATEKVTEAGPVPVFDDVIVNQLAFAAALQSQVAPVEMFTEPVDAADGTESVRVESDGAQGPVAAKTLDAWLAVEPPGPTAETRAL